MAMYQCRIQLLDESRKPLTNSFPHLLDVLPDRRNVLQDLLVTVLPAFLLTTKKLRSKLCGGEREGGRERVKWISSLQEMDPWSLVKQQLLWILRILENMLNSSLEAQTPALLLVLHHSYCCLQYELNNMNSLSPPNQCTLNQNKVYTKPSSASMLLYTLPITLHNCPHHPPS